MTLRSATAGPLRLSRFFGRERAMTELAEIVEESRLVTLVGAPGCGKTRLGLELGALLAGRFSAGMHVVEFASVVDPSLVGSTVAAALGVDDRPDRSVEDALVAELGPSEVLIVLDNCEHMVGAIAPLVLRMLGECPSLHILATSRISLGLQGERVRHVPPLELEPATDLFRDRSGLSARDPVVDATDHDVVEEICRRLDGLPLAIELAAAWTRMLTPSEILARLEGALPLLRGHVRDADPRHRTMAATVDWSYSLLEPVEQQLFERVSVFMGGFDFDAAQAVSTGDDVLDDLASLVAQSLVLAKPDSAGAMRYTLLEPVRQFGESRLAISGNGETTRRQHADHYLDVALRCDAELRNGRRPGAVLGRLEVEESNIRAALAWARGQPDDLGLRLSTAMANSWAIRGRVKEGRAWLEEMLALHTETADRRLRASALGRASRLAWRQRDYPATGAFLEESLAIEQELGDAVGVARRLRSLGVLAMARGELAKASQLCQQSGEIFRGEGDLYGLSLALAFQGMTLQLSGDAALADKCVREALELNRQNGNITGALYGLGSMAFGAVAAGDMVSLRGFISQIAELLRTLDGIHEDPGWLWWTAVALASGEGRYDAAVRLAGAAQNIAERDGLYLHEQLRRQVLPWLERARAQIGPAKTGALSTDGARLTLDELLDEALREPSDDESHAALTPRELEIAELVAAGLTNREIAQQLVISRRTVESHVDHIKRKLGFARRARIVAWVLGRAPDGSLSR